VFLPLPQLNPTDKVSQKMARSNGTRVGFLDLIRAATDSDDNARSKISFGFAIVCAGFVLQLIYYYKFLKCPSKQSLIE
jgi:hypothetical protein